MQPKLSVIIPVYNVEKYIQQCLDSVYSQTFRDFEVIIIDDGSPDNCGKICDEYAEKYGDEIKTKVIHKENGGLCRARNDGIDAAQGEWITFVDSDDWIEPDYYEAMFKALGNQEVDIFVAGECYINEPDGKQKISYTFDTSKLYKTPEELDYMLVKVLLDEKKRTKYGKKFLCASQAPWDKIYRAEFINKISLKYLTSLSANEDVLFNFIAFGHAKCIGTGSVRGYHYRQVEGSIVHSLSIKKVESKITVLEAEIDFLNNNDRNPLVKSALNARAITYAGTVVGYFAQNPSDAEKMDNYLKKPCLAEAIYEGKNPYETIKDRIKKIILRLPSSVIIKIYMLYSKIK